MWDTLYVLVLWSHKLIETCQALLSETDSCNKVELILLEVSMRRAFKRFGLPWIYYSSALPSMGHQRQKNNYRRYNAIQLKLHRLMSFLKAIVKRTFEVLGVAICSY